MAMNRMLLRGLPHALNRVPGLRRLPIFRLLAIGEMAMVTRRHMEHLDAQERRRLATLVRRGTAMSPAEREELRALVAKLDVRAFAGSAVSRLSPIPLPKRFTRARY